VSGRRIVRPAQRTRAMRYSDRAGRDARGLFWNHMRQGVWMVLAGVLVGFGGRQWPGHARWRFLVFVSLTDPSTFVAVPSLLATVALMGLLYISAAGDGAWIQWTLCVMIAWEQIT